MKNCRNCKYLSDSRGKYYGVEGRYYYCSIADVGTDPVRSLNQEACNNYKFCEVTAEENRILGKNW